MHSDFSLNNRCGNRGGRVITKQAAHQKLLELCTLVVSADSRRWAPSVGNMASPGKIGIDPLSDQGEEPANKHQIFKSGCCGG